MQVASGSRIRRQQVLTDTDKVVMITKGTGQPYNNGVTLVEMLVVIAIIGALAALILPAIEMSRESARRASCANNLKQQGLAIKLHIDSQQIFPTGGWGAEWVGDPNGGYSTKQPGGWIYNVLPYMEQSSLRQMGQNLHGDAKKQSISQLLQTPLGIFQCPSRRLPRAYAYVGPVPLKNADPPKDVAKSDYVINRLVSQVRSEVIVSEIQLKKGLSRTLLAGEKAVHDGSYKNGQAAGDGLSMYAGDSADIGRDVKGSASADAEGGSGYGAAHPSGINVVYCDGSVHFINEGAILEPAVN